MDPADSLTLLLQPIALLPGVGLLVMSTSSRFSRLHDELHRALHDHADPVDRLRITAHLLRRARLFRNALVLLYLAVGFVAGSGLLGGIAMSGSTIAAGAAIILVGLGVAAILGAAGFLLVESVQAMHILTLEVQHMLGTGSSADDAGTP